MRLLLRKRINKLRGLIEGMKMSWTTGRRSAKEGRRLRERSRRKDAELTQSTTYICKMTLRLIARLTSGTAFQL